MTATLPDEAAKNKRASSRRRPSWGGLARRHGLSLTGPDGLLKQLTSELGDDELSGAIGVQAAHGSPSVFEPAVVGLDAVVNVTLNVVPGCRGPVRRGLAGGRARRR